MAATGRDTADSAQAGKAPVRLRLLGGVELEGRPTLRFLPERRFRLVAYLALRADWVSRDQLATLFWPDRSQPAARSNLRKLLLEVRALALPQLESDRNGLRWRIATDVAEFSGSSSPGFRPQPAPVVNLSGVVAIDFGPGGGLGHAAALKSDGTVWSWGWNSNGQLGNGTIGPSTFATSPVQASGLNLN